MSPIRVLTADDHPLIVDALPHALRGDGIDVVGAASSGSEVVRCYEETRPDVVVMDVRFSDGTSGLQASTDLLARHPEARIVFYTQFDQDEFIGEAYRLGGCGFVTKQKPLAALAGAIKDVHGGRVHFLPEIAERLALLSVKRSDSPRLILDKREFHIFQLMAQGHTNGEIADAMGLSQTTIAIIAPQIKHKLGAHRPADLTLLAVKHGILAP